MPRPEIVEFNGNENEVAPCPLHLIEEPRPSTSPRKTSSALVAALLVLSCGSGSSTGTYRDAAVASGGNAAPGTGGTGATGTGGSNGNGTGGAGGAALPVELVDFGTALIDAQCAFYARCALVTDAASCGAASWVDEATLTLQADVSAGRVVYDAAKAGACLTSIRDRACTYSGYLAQEASGTSCDGVFVGMVAAGGTCLASGECAGSANCLLAAACSTSCCAGTCVAPAAIGASCASNFCVNGAYCRSTNRCAAQQTTEGSVCDATDACKPPLFCIPDGTGTGTCGKVLPQTGAVCDPLVGCDNFGDYCSSARVCTKLVGIGQACTAETETTFDNCVNYGYCAAGVCKAYGAAGAVCESNADGSASNCQGMLVCPATTAVCTAPPAARSCR